MSDTKNSTETKTPSVEETTQERAIYLTDFFKTLCNNEKFADVFFIVGRGKKQKRFAGHKLILAASSPLFEAMLYPPAFAKNKVAAAPEPLEIKVEGTSPLAFQAMLECVYTDTTEVDSSNIAQLIAVAKKYQIEKLQILCSSFMSDDINMDNALELFQIAPDLLGDESFGLPFIRENAEEVFASDGVLNLTKSRFVTLLADDGLAVDEITLFNVAQKWAKAQIRNDGGDENDQKALQSTMKDILPLIRFPTMEVSDLAANVATTGLLSQTELLNLFKYVSITDQKLQDDMQMNFPTKDRQGGFSCKDSKLLKKEYKKDLLKMFGKNCKKLKLELLYRATRDGSNGSSFHSKVDGKGPTLCLIIATSGNVFGGYYEGNWQGSGQYQSNTKAFIFSLKNETGKTVCMLPTQTTNHVYCHSTYGPTWGGGHDLHVNNNMMSNSNYCNPNSYKKFHPDFHQGTYDNKLIAGSYNWTMAEMEVFKVTQ